MQPLDRIPELVRVDFPSHSAMSLRVSAARRGCLGWISDGPQFELVSRHAARAAMDGLAAQTERSVNAALSG
jgi:hypothetical protein